jgi:hypothetical protein
MMTIDWLGFPSTPLMLTLTVDCGPTGAAGPLGPTGPAGALSVGVGAGFSLAPGVGSGIGEIGAIGAIGFALGPA